MNFIKNCPNCGIPTFKTDGCNYMKCSDGDGRSNYPIIECFQEWCWQCEKPKYKNITSKDCLGYCNDITHNSH